MSIPGPDTAQQLRTLIDAWGLALDDAASALGVDEGQVASGLQGGMPQDHGSALSDLPTATSLLQAHVRSERIPEVVWRSASRLAHRSLLELARAGLHREVLDAVQHMFDLRRSQP